MTLIDSIRWSPFFKCCFLRSPLFSRSLKSLAAFSGYWLMKDLLLFSGWITVWDWNVFLFSPSTLFLLSMLCMAFVVVCELFCLCFIFPCSLWTFEELLGLILEIVTLGISTAVIPAKWGLLSSLLPDLRFLRAELSYILPIAIMRFSCECRSLLSSCLLLLYCLLLVDLMRELSLAARS